MSVLKLNSKLADCGIGSDSRFRRWGKLVRDAGDVDLTKDNGYSLSGPFVSWGKAFVMTPGQFIVVAGESGSRARHSYDFALIRIAEDGELVVVDDEIVDSAVQHDVRDAYVANAMNSRLFAYALYCSHAFEAQTYAGQEAS